MQLIDQAQQLATADVAALTADHARLAPEAKAAAVTAAAAAAGESSSDRVKELQGVATQQNILSILDDRLSAQQQLVTLYGRWHGQVELQHKMLLHLMLQSLTLIAAIVLLTILAGWGLQAAFDRMSQDRRQRQTLRTILNLGTSCW
jgi:outer membrane murein-binding lipoprotein Lpp